jgi:type III restriction enzyme
VDWWRSWPKPNAAARLWISGLETVNRKLGTTRVIELSATPFFLCGSGYAEGTPFPRAMSDFSRMDAIECGIVKLVYDFVSASSLPDKMTTVRTTRNGRRNDVSRAPSKRLARFHRRRWQG